MTLYASAREKIRTYTPLRSTILSKTAPIPVSTMSYDPPPAYDSHPRNVVIFGETGTGKSSVVNLIAGYKLAETCPDAGACTFASDPYHVVFQEDQPYCVWDTIGLNEPEMSRGDYLRAIKEAYKLIKELERSGGVHLLLLCMRGRITRSVQQNYKLFVKVLCEKKVPLGVVVTHLENERCMEEWWTANQEVFRSSGIYADGHACITASPAIEVILPEKYKESRERVHELLRTLTLSTRGGWRKEKQRWLIDLLGKMAKMLLPRRSRSSQGPTREDLTKKLVNECGFSCQEAKSIAASIIEVIRDQTPDSDGGSL